MGTLDSVTCTSAIFAWWKVRGSKFAQPPDGGVFGSGVLRRAWYVTRTACLTRILTRTAQAVSERARQSTSQCRRRRASRAPVTVNACVSGTGRHRSAFARSGRAGRRWSCTTRPTGHLVMDHSITGLIDCPSAHLPTRTDRPTSRPTSVTGEARARSGQLARRLLRGGERQPSKGGQLRTRSGMSTTSPARLIALLTPSAHARPHFVGAVPPNRAQIC